MARPSPTPCNKEEKRDTVSHLCHILRDEGICKKKCVVLDCKKVLLLVGQKSLS